MVFNAMNTLDKLQKAFPESYRNGNILLINADCMDVMKLLDDKEFCLACVDPPYGINRSGQTETFTKNPKHKRKFFEKKNWDLTTPQKKYFDELFRISKNQIIWGANYFTEFLPPSMGWLFWDKGQDLSMSDGELAYSSFNKALRRFKINRGQLMLEGGTIHPTQKPILLYNKCFDFAKIEKGQKVFDSHLGSASSAIAAHYFGVDFVGCELDKDYFEAAKARVDMATKQLAMSI
jgi:site-specific DNA-methyltransferase (adenine-specific)